MTLTRRAAAVLAATVLVLAGCGQDSQTAEPQTAERPTAESPLAFTATTVDGEPFDGRSLAGKPAVLWFWAPWCPTCLGQAPGVREAVAAHGDRVSIVGVAGLDKADAMPDFIRMTKLEGIQHISDEAGDVWKRFGVREQSVFLFFDAAGEVTFHGKLAADEIPARVAALLD
jgi:thiol-disulfide isomerase/thioredoxin